MRHNNRPQTLNWSIRRQRNDERRQTIKAPVAVGLVNAFSTDWARFAISQGARHALEVAAEESPASAAALDRQGTCHRQPPLIHDESRPTFVYREPSLSRHSLHHSSTLVTIIARFHQRISAQPRHLICKVISSPLPVFSCNITPVCI